ncbi:MAG TPA: HD domain-containing phosphohydrolase [Acidimicrobiia bacterium]
MADWNERTVVVFSWMFPFVAAGAGILAYPSATSDPLALIVGVTALVIGSLIGVATSNSGNRFTTGLAVAAAMPLVLVTPLGGVDLAGTIVTYGVGLAAVWAMRLSRGETHADLLPTMVRRFAGYVTYAVVYSSMRVGVFESFEGGWEDLLPFAVALIAWLAVEVLMRALFILGPRELSRTYLARALLHDLNVFMGLTLTGALFGELFPALKWWALPIALLPYSFAHSAFARFQETKVTYKQTIRALARIPEVSGLGVNGHADRTTEIASSIAKEMGLGPLQVEHIEFAGLMHDIGRVSLNEPQILKMGYTPDDIARWSAEIIAEAPYLDRVAGDVRNQYEPFRRPGEESDPDVSMVSRIIKVAAAYDWQVYSDRRSPLQALEHLHAGTAYEFDPAVVTSLRRILTARGVIGRTRDLVG